MRNLKFGSHMALIAPSALFLVAGLPLETSKADGQIEASAKNSYNFKTYLKDENIKIACSSGVVTLTGTVSRDFHKTLAEETLAGMRGVKKVNNRLTLLGDQPAEHSDEWVNTKAMAALLFHKNINATGINVQTENGVVTLSGNTDSLAQKELITEYVKDVEGAKEVRNEMIVSPPAMLSQDTLIEKVDDASITAQIKTTLLVRKSTHALATKVITQDGEVTLSGEVNNAAEKNLVAKLAENIKGVKRVNNRITVPES